MTVCVDWPGNRAYPSYDSDLKHFYFEFVLLIRQESKEPRILARMQCNYDFQPVFGLTAPSFFWLIASTVFWRITSTARLPFSGLSPPLWKFRPSVFWVLYGSELSLITCDAKLDGWVFRMVCPRLTHNGTPQTYPL